MKRFQIFFKKLFPYIIAFAAIFAVMAVGSLPKQDESSSPIVASFNSSTLALTSDQVAETYTVAGIANTVALPSAATISENYVTVSNLYATTGTVATSETIVAEKPTIIDVSSLSRGIITYVVQDGDTLDSIIAANNIKASKDQVRWSNSLKKEGDIKVGDTLYLPTIAGIIREVKDGDTAEKLAESYESDASLIISYNDLEDKELSAGMHIILPNGTLPEEERPEYVKPTPQTPVYTPTYTYTYVTDSGQRHGIFEIGNYSYWSNMYYSTSWQHNPGAYGNCTWFAWYWRRNNMSSEYWLPGGTLGNARDWIYTLSGSYWTGRTPAYGAIQQSSSGYYGHVAVVVGVEEGVSVTIQEMNWNGGYNRVYQSTMDWSDALGYNYIYQHK